MTVTLEKFVTAGRKAQTAVDDAIASAPQPDIASVTIPLAKIVPSKTNPGRSFDPARDNDTVESIRVHGVLQPILVRPGGVAGSSFQVKGSYEIVAGERRFHCSTKAGRTHITAVVRELTDVEALEIQTIENDQREDLDPLAKAAAFRRLWDAYSSANKGDAEKRMELMVQRLGRKPRTVWNLLSLGNLSAQGQKMLTAGEISQSHAYEICRRTPAEQKKILDWFQDESRYETISVRDLKEHIRDECDRFLDAAPFDKKDANLFPAAGACVTCQKNTAVNPNLVDPEDLKGKNGGKRAICTDGECFQKKVAANLVQIEQAAKKAGAEIIRVSTRHTPPKGAKAAGEWKQVKPGSCQYAVAAVLVDDDNSGKQIVVCFATNMCKDHWIGRAASGSSEGFGRAGHVNRPRSDAEKKAMLQKSRHKQLDQAYRTAATVALRKQVKSLKAPDLKEVAVVLFDRLDRRLQNPVMKAMGWKESGSFYGVNTPVSQIAALQPAGVAQLITLLTIADNVLPAGDYWGHRSPIKLDAFARRHKVNLKKIHAAAAAPLLARWKVIDARKKAAARNMAKNSAKSKTKAKPAQTIAKKKAAKKAA